MESETLGRLISVHKTPTIQTWFSLAFIGLGLAIALAGVAKQEASPIVFGILLSLYFFTSTGLPGRPAKHIEIYEEGIVHKGFWTKRVWQWSDFSGVRSAVKYNSAQLQLQASDGSWIKVPMLSDWSQMRQLILQHVESVIYQRAMDQLRRGKTIPVNYELKIKEYGVVYDERYVSWQDVDSVERDKHLVIIYSNHFNNLNNRVRLDTYRSLNGFIYAKLIQHLWQIAKSTPQSSESAQLVINGVHFNSEGEMIHEKSD